MIVFESRELNILYLAYSRASLECISTSSEGRSRKSQKGLVHFPSMASRSPPANGAGEGEHDFVHQIAIEVSEACCYR